jgi:hypothetical protein
MVLRRAGQLSTAGPWPWPAADACPTPAHTQQTNHNSNPEPTMQGQHCKRLQARSVHTAVRHIINVNTNKESPQ